MSLLNKLQYDAGSQTLSLDTAELGTLGDVLRQSTGSGKLVITGVTAAPVESGGTISFAGNALQPDGSPSRLFFPPAKTVSVSCAIYEADTDPVLVLSVLLAPEWRFTDTLPLLRDTFWSELALKAGGGSFPSPRWIIATGKITEPDLGLELNEGIHFYGTFDESKGLFESADWMIGTSPVGFGAVIAREGGPPSLSIGITVRDNKVGFAGVFPNMSVPVEAALVYDPSTTDTPSGLQLAATITWTGQPLKIRAVIPISGVGIAELTVLGPLALPSDDEIAGFFGGKSVTQYLPPPFMDALDSIHIDSLALGIGLGSKCLEYARVTLTVMDAHPFTVVPNWVTIEHLTATVTVTSPFQTPSASYKMSGILDIGGVDLLVSANLMPSPRIPDLTVVVQMEPWSEIDLTMIADKFGLPKGAYKINVNEFQMSASISGTYFIRAELEEHRLGNAPDVFVMSNLIFELDFDGQPNFILEGNMEIAGVDAHLSLAAGSGGESGSTGTGWDIRVQAGKDSPITMGDLLADLAGKFGLEDVPAPVKSIELRNVELHYSSQTSGDSSFLFTLEGDLTVKSTAVAVVLTIRVTEKQEVEGESAVIKYDAFFGGHIIIGSLQFDLLFDTNNRTSQSFMATYSHQEGSSSAISIHDLVAGISAELASEIPPSLTIGLRDAKFVFYKNANESKFMLGLDLGADFSPTDLPLIGKKLPSSDSIAVRDLQILYASEAFTAAQTAVINKLLPNESAVKPLPSEVGKGLTAGAEIRFGGTPQTLSFPLTGAGGTNTNALKKADPPVVAKDASAASAVKWFNVQKSFGPVSLNRLGIGYQDGMLWFMLDGALTLSGLTISLIGMGFGTRLDHFDLKFQLHGIGLDYSQEPLMIGGSFMEVVPPPAGTKYLYEGAASIQTEKFALEAIGSYAQMLDGQPSMFVFANLDTPLGGPPALFINGLSAGFGYNRNAEMPAPDEVFEFPLLALTQDNGPKLTMSDVMGQLEGTLEYAPGKKKAWIRPESGEYWLAVGVDFWSYELLHTRALLIGKFGKELELALLGLSSIRLPQAGSAIYAYAELELEADWKPSAGFFGLEALLTPNSFLIDPNCRLTGGFAFYLWYEGEKEGQFVVTFGGYHPKFIPPAYYPSVPRIGFNWAVSDKVHIHGEAYFALTPAAVMAGGGLEVLFRDRALKAWFTALADMLVTFHPFHYSADISVSIGASYRLNLLFATKTISVELGASLELWGPKTGGKAKVHWYVISFTVGFGAERSEQNTTPIEWNEFKPLLPSLDNVCKIIARDGLTGSLTNGDPPTVLNSGASTGGKGSGLPQAESSVPSDSGGNIWLVRTGQFSFSTQTAIPASRFAAGNAMSPVADPKYPDPYNVRIRPMNKTGVDSLHHITVQKDNDDHDISHWQLEPYYRSMPSALWGEPLKDAGGRFMRNPQSPSSDTIADVPVGLTVTPPPPKIGYSEAELPIELLKYDDLTPQGQLPLEANAGTNADYRPCAADNTPGDIADIMGAAARNRDAIFAALCALQAYGGSNGPLTNLGKHAGELFANSPMQAKA
ncbi:DUF6603 domain-containing protein [Paenibacillus tarimensis]